ncbi:DASS family sodium-coupled anion symporter [uncultured Thalassolituus sp.]|mgnify:CR=1 FL=1|uniref:SLC13 family permease n=1 Tax=uncultured Thalassolituus sp. TaxID=285273 RepID=UPI0026158445|nr:DASS family sodium-coupled anion symporter [uncultured Thalassolituus sp.]
MPGSNLIIVFNALLFAAMQLWLPFEPAVVDGLSILIFIAILWLTEALDVSITALLVPTLAVVFGVLDTGDALSKFADPIIFIFLGGFALASALHAQKIDAAIANKVLDLARGRFNVAVFMLFAVSAGLSMWISNTATTAMMLPLVLGVLHQLNAEDQRPTYVFVLLGIAYCASIGGIATLVGSPPNAIAAAQSNLTFADWLVMAGPLSMILLPVILSVLFAVIRPNLNHRFSTEHEPLEWTRPRLLALGIFAFTVVCWIFSTPLNRLLGGLPKFDTLIAIMAIVLLGLSRVVTWKQIEKTTDWSVLMLFGGGICLSAVLKATGTSVFLADHIGGFLQGAPLLLVILAVVAFVVFLTEFASNTASAALLVPVFAAIAENLGIPAVILSALIAVAASCAFMLPVATPPNAIVYGSGYVAQKDMMRTGFWINLSCIAVISGYAWVVW